METTEAPAKRKGNPMFGKKKEVSDVFEIDEDKIYEFELVNAFPQYRPVDKEKGQPLTSPYPPVYGIPNEGVAFDETFDNGAGKSKGRARNWRLIDGQPSIWVDEQVSLENLDKKEIYAMLGQSENILEFREGKLMVRGMEKLRLQALMIQDLFEGKSVQYKQKNRAYRLNNPDLDVSKELSLEDRKYQAMKAANECDTEAMVEAAFVMGINVDDVSDLGLKRIKRDFLQKAQYDPKNPEALTLFVSIVNNPVTKLKYVFGRGVSNGILVIDNQALQLRWAQSGAVICDITHGGNQIEKLCGRVIDGDKLLISVLEEIENQLEL